MCSTLAPTFGWKRQNSIQKRQQSSHGAKRWWMVDGGHCSLTIWSWMRQSQALWNGLDLLGSYWCPSWRSSCPTLEWTRLSWWLVPLQTAERLRLWNSETNDVAFPCSHWCLWVMCQFLFQPQCISCDFRVVSVVVIATMKDSVQTLGKQHCWPTATVWRGI